MLRRVVGGGLILLVVVPFWHLLSQQTGPLAREAIRLSDSYAAASWQGTILLLLVAGAAALLIPPTTYERPLARFWAVVSSFSSVRFALALAIMSGALTAGLSFYLSDAKPVLVDVLAQFVQARYLAEGMAAAPSGFPFEFWIVANTFVTDNGWVSQYPPGHGALLAVGLRLGAVWAVGPLLMATTTLFTALAAERLFPRDRAIARLGALLVAVSPFLITLAAMHMSHVSAAALVSLAAYCALRARDDGWGWAVAAGVAVGGVFATRPLSAVTIGAVVTVGVWLTGLAGREQRLRYLGTRVVAAFIGALPLVLAVAAYNAHFFDSPFRFGYLAYLGPHHGLGFHADPRGNFYGPLDGLGYTSSDLLALGFFLFRTPISVVLIIGVFLLVARRLSSGSRLVTAWALALVLPLAFYWHHDLFLGPRLLSDAAPAWCLLAAVATVGLVRRIPAVRRLAGNRFSPRVFGGVALLLSVIVGFGYLTPRDLRDYARTFASQVAPLKSVSPVLVFVHDNWNDRMVAQLLANGMRADSVTVALARNSSCRMNEFTAAYASRRAGDTMRVLPALEFAVAANDGSEPTRLPSGVVVRARPDEQLAPECRRQARSDRHGTLPLMPLLWQGDLPGLGGGSAMYVRDLGPATNAALIDRFPERRPVVLFLRERDRSPTVVAYELGMEVLWGEAGTGGDGQRR